MKFLKTIRFDGSDEFVFDNAAETGSWAIPGGFMFTGQEPDSLSGKPRQAFRNGFMAIEDRAWSTFVTVGEIDAASYDQLGQTLAAYLAEKFNAPSATAASEAANAELAFAAEICAAQPINTVFSVLREFDDNGDVKEAFSIVQAPQAPVHAKVWEIVEE